ncbi:hypothetical protein C8R45DRAFT_1111574 [Mycena sanguinolenta]|nr:hypothetical protein C8R45DRAFT_1111574 [Mycena sanguinolenta]
MIGVLVFSKNRPLCVVNLKGVEGSLLMDPRAPTYLQAVARFTNLPAAGRVGTFAGLCEWNARAAPRQRALRGGAVSRFTNLEKLPCRTLGALRVHSLKSLHSPPITLRISHSHTPTCRPRPRPRPTASTPMVAVHFLADRHLQIVNVTVLEGRSLPAIRRYGLEFDSSALPTRAHPTPSRLSSSVRRHTRKPLRCGRTTAALASTQ